MECLIQCVQSRPVARCSTLEADLPGAVAAAVQPVNVIDPAAPAALLTFVRANARPDLPEVGGTFEVASFNVLNYFTTYGDRGADNEAEFLRQAAKIVEAIIAVDADVVGLMEIENDGTAIAMKR